MTEQPDLDALVQKHYDFFKHNTIKNISIPSINNSIPLEKYFNIAQQYYEQALDQERMNCTPSALYALWKKFAIFALEVIPNHKDYKNSSYKKRRHELKQNSDAAVTKLTHISEDLKVHIRSRLVEQQQQQQQQELKIQQQNDNHNFPVENLSIQPSAPEFDDNYTQEVSEFEQKYSTTNVCIENNGTISPLNPNILQSNVVNNTTPVPSENFNTQQTSMKNDNSSGSFPINAGYGCVSNSNQTTINLTPSTTKFFSHTPSPQLNQLNQVNQLNLVHSGFGFGYPTTQNEAAVRRQEALFREILQQKNLYIVEMRSDGNCLFRAVAHQIYGDNERHVEVRSDCCKYMWEHRNRFGLICDSISSFSQYIEKRRNPVNDGEGEWGDDPEIRAMEEVFDRPFEIWSVETAGKRPLILNLSNEDPLELRNVSPIRLSYHGNNHYNSLVTGDPKNWTGLELNHTTFLRDFRRQSLRK